MKIKKGVLVHIDFNEISEGIFVVPESATSIGKLVFAGYADLKGVVLHKGVTSIGDSAFHGCTSLESITIPDSVTSIGHNAFRDCVNLRSITLGRGLKSIGDHAFDRCDKLTSIDLPHRITRIEKGTFAHCNQLTSVTFPDTLETVSDSAFVCCNRITILVFPESLKHIENFAFYECSNLRDVSAPYGTRISPAAFYHCPAKVVFRPLQILEAETEIMSELISEHGGDIYAAYATLSNEEGADDKKLRILSRALISNSMEEHGWRYDNKGMWVRNIG